MATEIVLPAIGEPETLEVRQRELPAPGAGQGDRARRGDRRLVRRAVDAPRALPRRPAEIPVRAGLRSGGDGGSARSRCHRGRGRAAGGGADQDRRLGRPRRPARRRVAARTGRHRPGRGRDADRQRPDRLADAPPRSAHAQRGQTILVHGASGGVGTTLVQLARHAGIRVIGTAAPRHHAALRELGVEPLDYNDPDLVGSVRTLAPGGVDAAFDHVGIQSATRSFGLLAPGGTLVCYGMINAIRDKTPALRAFASMISRITLWNLLPNGRRATFYDLWGGHLVRRTAFYRRARTDLAQILALLADGCPDPADRRPPAARPRPPRRCGWPSRAPSSARWSSSRR